MFEISIGDLANLIITQMNTTMKIKTSIERFRPEKSEVERLICNNSKILTHTSWRPKYSLKQGIKEVIEWMQIPENKSHYKSEIYNV